MSASHSLKSPSLVRSAINRVTTSWVVYPEAPGRHGTDPRREWPGDGGPGAAGAFTARDHADGQRSNPGRPMPCGTVHLTMLDYHLLLSVPR